MQVQSLKLYCDLADTKSFTKAAQINGVTQSAVSQQISSLEKHFKSLLIERSKKAFRLTREGNVLYDFSKQIVESFEGLQSELQVLQNVFSGTIRVASVYSIGLHSLQAYVTRFLQNYPTVNVHVEYRRANRVYEDVLGNSVDLGLVACPKTNPLLEIVPLREEVMVLICHPEHRLAKSKRVKVKALEGERFIVFDPDIPTRKATDAMLKAQGVTIQAVMQFDNIETMKRAVEVHSGLAIVPQTTVKREVADGSLVQVEFEDVKFMRPTALIYKKGKSLSPSMKEFIRLLREGE